MAFLQSAPRALVKQGFDILHGMHRNHAEKGGHYFLCCREMPLAALSFSCRAAEKWFRAFPSNPGGGRVRLWHHTPPPSEDVRRGRATHTHTLPPFCPHAKVPRYPTPPQTAEALRRRMSLFLFRGVRSESRAFRLESDSPIEERSFLIELSDRALLSD